MLDQPLALARLTLTDPKSAARMALSPPLNRMVLVEALVMLCCLSVVVAIAPFFLMGGNSETFSEALGHPFLFAVIQIALQFVLILGVYMVGGYFGGTGSFDDVFQALVWLQSVILGLQVIEVPLILLIPAVETIVTIAIAFYSLWLTVNFIAAVHRFQSLMAVLAIFIGTTFLAAFVLLLIWAILGLA